MHKVHQRSSRNHNEFPRYWSSRQCPVVPKRSGGGPGCWGNPISAPITVTTATGPPTFKGWGRIAFACLLELRSTAVGTHRPQVVEQIAVSAR
jgi:hypothetical protein